MHSDDFEDLARYYDVLMDHVDYDRWFMIAAALADLLPKPFTHMDAGCGTGVLLERLRAHHWRSIGLDLSPAMLRQARRQHGAMPVAAADIRALPIRESADYVTCLFDSLNFLLDEKDVGLALREFAGALRPGGLLYFDVVTERMVLEHFADQSWTETNEHFISNWECTYDRKTTTTETRIRINNGPECIITERVYSLSFVKRALKEAGLELLGAFDAESWRSPRRKSVRIDFVAVKGSGRTLVRPFREITEQVRTFFT